MRNSYSVSIKEYAAMLTITHKGDKKNVKKRLEEYDQTKPQQLTLFEYLSPQEASYSNTIELYDFMPKYYWGKVERINERFLEFLEREFECRGERYKLKVSPARIKDADGVTRDYYPGQREELVEDALRKLAAEGQGVFLDDQASVCFTLYQLEQELKESGHHYSRGEIKDALLVCVNTGLEVKTEDGSSVLASHIFETLGLQTREDWKDKDHKTRCFVRFNPLVTTAIKNQSFRQINYEKTMSFRSVIARQLHKRMSHHYTQASLLNSYSILLSTIIRDFGLKQYAELRNNLRDVKKALEEMKQKEIIVHYEVSKIIDTEDRNKLIDAKFTLTPHPFFSSDVTKANVQQQKRRALRDNEK